jgi:hypothetical protein
LKIDETFIVSTLIALLLWVTAPILGIVVARLIERPSRNRKLVVQHLTMKQVVVTVQAPRQVDASPKASSEASDSDLILWLLIGAVIFVAAGLLFNRFRLQAMAAIVGVSGTAAITIFTALIKLQRDRLLVGARWFVWIGMASWMLLCLMLNSIFVWHPVFDPLGYVRLGGSMGVNWPLKANDIEPGLYFGTQLLGILFFLVQVAWTVVASIGLFCGLRFVSSELAGDTSSWLTRRLADALAGFWINTTAAVLMLIFLGFVSVMSTSGAIWHLVHSH